MLERILPECVAVASSTGDLDAPLFPEEEEIVGRAVEKRRREFVTARACARQALEGLGLPARAILAGEKGEPIWPEGVVGSITHCSGYRASALARSTDLVTIGVDAEIDEPLPDGLLSDIALPEERRLVFGLDAQAPGTSWDRLLFSIKESIYKAWYPLTKRWLGFEDAVVTIDRHRQRFSARLLVSGPSVDGVVIDGFSGRWLAGGGLLLAAIALPVGLPSTGTIDVALAGEQVDD